MSLEAVLLFGAILAVGYVGVSEAFRDRWLGGRRWVIRAVFATAIVLLVFIGGFREYGIGLAFAALGYFLSYRDYRRNPSEAGASV